MGVGRVGGGGLSAPGPRIALFLDRDGILNQPVWDPRAAAPESPLTIEQVELVPDAAAVVHDARASGLVVVVVSNQPAAAKRAVSRSRIHDVHRRVLSLLAARGASVDHSYLCLHHPQGSDPALGVVCRCRKPAPGMLEQAARDLGLDLSASWHIGDTDADVGAARAARLAGVAIVANPLSAHRRGRSAQGADVVVDNLTSAFRHVLHAIGRAGPTAGA